MESSICNIQLFITFLLKYCIRIIFIIYIERQNFFKCREYATFANIT